MRQLNLSRSNRCKNARRCNGRVPRFFLRIETQSDGDLGLHVEEHKVGTTVSTSHATLTVSRTTSTSVLRTAVGNASLDRYCHVAGPKGSGPEKHDFRRYVVSLQWAASKSSLVMQATRYDSHTPCFWLGETRRCQEKSRVGS